MAREEPNIQRDNIEQFAHAVLGAADDRGHLGSTVGAGVGGLFGGVAGSFLGPLGAGLGAAAGAWVGAHLGGLDDPPSLP